MTNDWGSPTGFSYTLGFVLEGMEVVKTDEKVELAGGGIIYIERKAIWVGEGGLLGSTMDIDENFHVTMTPKAPKA